MSGDRPANVADVIGRWAAETPCAVAIAERARLVSYRELDEDVRRAAARLAAAGIRAGDRVGLSLAGNSALYLVMVYALARLGAVLLLLPVTEPPAYRLALARRLRLAAVIGADASAGLDGFPLLRPAVDGGDVGEAPVAAGGLAAWRICLSSGTTGEPKAMLRTHADEIQMCAIGHRQYGHAPGDRFIALIPFHFSYGLEEAMVTLAGGGAVVIPQVPLSRADLCALIEREDVTRLAITPTLAAELLPHFTGQQPRLPGLQRFSISTMYTPEALRRELRRRVTANLVICYGTNELWYITAADVATQLRFPETAGFPVDGVTIEVVDDQDRPLPPGEVGLVRLRGPTLPAGYLDDPEATAKAFRLGWYYPGDLGVLAPEGALFLKGRADDMINCDGIKIYPAEIELALLRHPAVVEAAAFPVTIEDYREIPIAAVVPRGEVSADELVAFCREQIGARAPRGISLFAELPKTATGKVLKRELAQRLAQAVAQWRQGER